MGHLILLLVMGQASYIPGVLSPSDAFRSGVMAVGDGLQLSVDMTVGNILFTPLAIDTVAFPEARASASPNFALATAGETTIAKAPTHMSTSTSSRLLSSTKPLSIASTQNITSRTPLTASQFLDNTSIVFRESRSGPFTVLFNTKLNDGTIETWDLNATTVGGVGTIAKFSTNFSCDPAPGDASSFIPQTKYNCTVSLTPTSGADERTQTKNFTFTTPAGELLVTPISSYNSVLTNDTNRSGFVFVNNDTASTTITGLTFDVSFTGLSLINGPLVLRVSDPDTETSLFDYHLENTPKDSTLPYTNSQQNITAQFSYSLPASSQKMLPVSVLGVDKMLMPGVNPTITIWLRKVTINRSDVKVGMGGTSQISWSCVVALTGYNPNATSDAFATGQVCRD